MIGDDKRSFKYRSLSTAMRCLEEGSLYFAAPSQLNDMLEVQYEYASSKISAQIMQEAVDDVVFKRGGTVSNVTNEVSEQLIAVIENEDQLLKAFTNQMGIFSTSPCPNNQAMWAYYADNSTGVCFELEWSDSVIKEHQLVIVNVQYSNAERIISRAEIFKTCLLRLLEEKPNADTEEIRRLSLSESFRRRWGVECAAVSASIKHNDWKHEKEVRVLAPRAGVKNILSRVLKRVHFAKIGGKDWSEVAMLLYTKYPEVEILKWDFHHGKITKSVMPMQYQRVRIK